MISHTCLNKEGLVKIHSYIIVITSPQQTSTLSLNSEKTTPTSRETDIKPTLTVEAVRKHKKTHVSHPHREQRTSEAPTLRELFSLYSK